MDDFSIHCAATEKLNRTTQVSTLVNDMSMELWIYPIAVTASGRTVFGNGFTGSTGWGIAIEIDGRFKSEISDGAAVGNPSVAYLPFSEWSHIGVVRNEGDWNYYRNGVTDSLANGPGAPGVPAGPVQIGAGSGLDLNFAYMAVYDSILEEADFARHYAARTTGPSIAWTTA